VTVRAVLILRQLEVAINIAAELLDAGDEERLTEWIEANEYGAIIESAIELMREERAA
jgi:hypothetical protein